MHPASVIGPGVRCAGALDDPVHLAAEVEVQRDVEVGRYSFVNARSVLYPGTRVGRFCSIGRGCEIGAARHPTHFLSTHTFQYHERQFPAAPDYRELERVAWEPHPPTSIGNDVWIGSQAIVPAGARIGDGAVVAANAVVTHDVAPYAIVAGSPARVLRSRFDAPTVQRLLALAWWKLPLPLLQGVPFDDIERALTLLEARRAAALRAG